jgi:hypothetical protein
MHSIITASPLFEHLNQSFPIFDSMQPAKQLKIQYIVKNFPQLSQTYIKTELRAVKERAETAIIATSVPNYPDPESYDYLQLSRIEDIVREVRDAHPDVIHTHYLNHVPIVHEVALALDIPYTVRAHSFDCLPIGVNNKLPAHLSAVIPMLNQDICRGVIAMPFAKEILTTVGLNPLKLIIKPPVVDVQHFLDTNPNEKGIMNTGACIPKKKMEDFLELAARLPTETFTLYAIGHNIQQLSSLNAARGSLLNIRNPVPYSQMPREYKKNNWMVYTASFTERTVGWPMAVVEAWAAGVVVNIARIRPDLDNFIGDAGFCYQSLEELVDRLLENPPPEMRERGFERAKSFDIRKNLDELFSLWSD